VSFWRSDGDQLVAMFGRDAMGEWPVIGGADPNSFIFTGDRVYARQPGVGLWFGAIDGTGGGVVLRGGRFEVSASGGGVLALIDGIAWRHSVVAGAERLGGDGLTQLRFVPAGATAWHEPTRTIWFLPGPSIGGQMAPVLANAASSSVLTEGADAVYVRGQNGFLRVALPPGADGPVAFDRPLEALSPVHAGLVLARDADDAFFAVDPATGRSTGWALHTTRIERSGRGTWGAYVCDRGLFVVPLP
ncbi:MAG: hypothetical protein KC620_23100, partial [Myxococcales bacterium]|nr:hypothetical protein [Myxococcales bacterium]